MTSSPEPKPRRTKLRPTSKHKNAEAASSTQLNPRLILTAAIAEHKGDVHKQVAYFFKHYSIPASQGRVRIVSAKTTTKYVLTVHMLLEVLQGKGVRVHSLDDLTSRQLLMVMRHWEANDIAASSLATYFSVLKRFYGWLGVKLPFASVANVLSDPKRGKRSMSATTSKGWSANGVQFSEVLTAVHAKDDVVALQLEMVAAFGLRVMEACAMKPIECDRGNHMIVMYGAKGGRGRTVEIETQYQRDVLDKAKAFARKHNGFIRRPGRTQKQAYKRFYNILQSLGISKNEKGVSAHGLRHEYANDLYTRLTGTQAPVNHGERLDLEDDRQARKVITEALGHSRLAITSAYLGSHVQMERAKKKRLARMHAELTASGCAMQLYHSQFQQQARTRIDSKIELRVFITGPAADGQEVKGVPIILACGYFLPSGMPSTTQVSEGEMQKLASVCQETLNQWCLGQHDSCVPKTVPRFELMFPE